MNLLKSLKVFKRKRKKQMSKQIFSASVGMWYCASTLLPYFSMNSFGKFFHSMHFAKVSQLILLQGKADIDTACGVLNTLADCEAIPSFGFKPVDWHGLRYRGEFRINGGFRVSSKTLRSEKSRHCWQMWNQYGGAAHLWYLAFKHDVLCARAASSIRKNAFTLVDHPAFRLMS